jgi:hypothetical protein
MGQLNTLFVGANSRAAGAVTAVFIQSHHPDVPVIVCLSSCRRCSRRRAASWRRLGFHLMAGSDTAYTVVVVIRFPFVHSSFRRRGISSESARAKSLYGGGQAICSASQKIG